MAQGLFASLLIEMCIRDSNMTDFTDILVDMVKEQEKEMTDAAGKKE